MNYNNFFNIEVKLLNDLSRNVRYEYNNDIIRQKRIKLWDDEVKNIINTFLMSPINNRIILIFTDCYLRILKISNNKVHMLFYRKHQSQYVSDIQFIETHVYNLFLKHEFIKLANLSPL